MKQNIHVLTAGGRLQNFSKQIESEGRKVIRKVAGRIPLPEVDILVIDNPFGAIPETGVGGFTYNPNLVQVSIDPENKNFKKNFRKEIASTVTHELNHCVRMTKFKYRTLLDALVFEGLADQFDVEINKTKPPVWAVAVKGKALEKLTARARKEFNNNNYNHADWFYGSKGRNIPRWAGYSIGFKLVGDYLEKNNKLASELVYTPAKKFAQK